MKHSHGRSFITYYLIYTHVLTWYLISMTCEIKSFVDLHASLNTLILSLYINARLGIVKSSVLYNISLSIHQLIIVDKNLLPKDIIILIQLTLNWSKYNNQLCLLLVMIYDTKWTLYNHLIIGTKANTNTVTLG